MRRAFAAGVAFEAGRHRVMQEAYAAVKQGAVRPQADRRESSDSAAPSAALRIASILAA